MYGAVDPIYMVMLIQLLGRNYIVWDKAAVIRFKKPGRTTLFARVQIDNSEVETIRALLAEQPKIDRVYHLQLTDGAGVVHADVEKTVHIRLRDTAVPA